MFAQNMDLIQLAENLGAKTLVNYLVDAGLDTVISSSGKFHPVDDDDADDNNDLGIWNFGVKLNLTR